ncbi:two-partner secretion domain-containing protein [Bartonella sp. B30(2025)]
MGGKMRGTRDRFACGSVFLRYVFGVLKRGLHKGLSLVLSFCVAFYPLLAQAQMMGSASSPSPTIQGIKAAIGESFSTRPTIGQANNGVVLIDIARPNNQGLSHNKYDSFNVDVHGVILNNSTENISRSQLGGLVFGNGNLRDTGAAKVILNEVVSSNHSHLEGVSEVHGQSADVIIANPNGITCNGCGFINTPRVTLSTGKPIIGIDGILSGFRVESGAITIGAQGADGRVLDIFDLVSRKISVAGPIQVKGDLSVIAGRNNFAYDKREATSLGTDGKEPELAIDSSDFGGMYAGQIRVIANDKGAGVKMHGSMVSNAGAMQLSSDGKLVIAKARAKGPVKAQSHHASVRVENLLFSESFVGLKALDAVELVDHARVAASGAVDVNSAVIKLEHDALLASGIGNDGQQSATGSLHLKASKLDAGSGRIASGDLLWIQAETIDLSRAEDNHQTGVSSLGNLTLETNTITALNNHIGASGSVILKAEDRLTIGAGHYSAGGSLLAEAAELSSYANLAAGQEIGLYTHSGQLIQEGALLSNGVVTLHSHGALNNKGDIVSVQQVSLTAGGVLTVGADSTLLGHDVILSANVLTQAGHVEAHGGALTLQVDDKITNLGTIRGDTVNAHAGSLINQGMLIATDELHLQVIAHQAAFPQQAAVVNASEGILQSGGAFVLSAGQLQNIGSLGSSGADVALHVVGDIHNSGLIYAKKSAAISLDGSFINKFGDVIAEDNFSIRGLNGDRAGHVINNSGLLEAVSGDMFFDVSTLTNMREGGVEITNKVVGYSYDPGEFVSHGIKHYTDKTTTETTIIREESHLINSAGQILAGRHLSINADDVNNSYSLIAANGNIVVRADSFFNQGRDLIETTNIVRQTRHRYKHCTVGNLGCLLDTTEEWVDPARTEIISHTYDAVYGTIESGGVLDAEVTGYLDNLAVREAADQIGLSSGDKGVFGVGNADFEGMPLISDERLDGMIDGLAGHTALFHPSAQTEGLQSVWTPTPDALPPVKTELVSAQAPKAPFLIETRPGFIDPGHFLGSDYFLDRLDFKLGQEFKRLGDAHFEYRLVNEQIFELTGNHSLFGIDDPNAQIQRLYDNAVEQQALLGLELGDPLSPKQIAGLKKDIIWLETHNVGGQNVLVPRVYLAPNSSSVQGTHQENFASARLKGNGLTLTAESFVNSGAVVSDGGLHVTTTKTGLNDGGFLVGTGAVEITSDDLFINSSGIVQGNMVAITAATVMNNTAKIHDLNKYGFIDRNGQKAQIIAVNDLSIQSLGDLSAYGGQFISGGSMALTVDGSATFGAFVLESAQAQTLEDSFFNAQSYHNQLSGLNSGGDLTIQTGGDLSLEGAKLQAEGDAQLTAGGDITLASVQDVSSSDWEVQRTKKGGLFSQKFHSHQHSEEVKTVKTTVEAGGKLSVHAQGGALTVVGAGLKSGGETHLQADRGQIQLLSTKDQDFKQSFQHDENLFWWSERDQGQLEESIHHVSMEAGGGIKIDAGNGIVVEYEKTGSFEKSLDELARIPELSWIKHLRDDAILAQQVNWQAVEARFEDWDYKSQGLTEAGAALVTLVVTALSSGTASTAASAITGALGVGSNAAMSAAINAGVQSLINKGAVSLINNGGNIGAVLQELGSSKAVLSIVSSMVTVGLTSQATAMAGVNQSLPKTAPVIERITHEAEKNIVKAVISTGIQTALEGGSLDENLLANLRTALSEVVGKTLAEEIGTAKAEGKINTVTQIVAHAGLGCLVGSTASGDCSAGAIGGAVGEAAAMLQFKHWVTAILQEEVGDLDGRPLTAEEQARINARFDAQFVDFKAQTIDVARIAGGFAAALAGGDVNTGADAAGNAAENNYLSSAQKAQKEKELAECSDYLCALEVSVRWSLIGGGQNVSLLAGVAAGVPVELFDTVNDLLHIGLHPIATLGALKDLITSGDLVGVVAQSYVERIDHLTEEFERAGAGGSFNAGLEVGKLLTEVVTLVIGGAGVAKGGIKLVGKASTKFVKNSLIEAAVEAETVGIKTGSEVAQSVEKVSSEANAIKTSGKAAQSIEKVNSEAAAIKTSDKVAQSIEKVSSEAVAIKTSGKAAQSIEKVSSEAAAIKTSGKAIQSIEKVSSEAVAIKTSGKVAQSIEKVSSEANAIKTSGKVAQSIEKVSSEAAAIKTSGKAAQSVEKVSSEAVAIKTSGKAAQSIEKVSSEAAAIKTSGKAAQSIEKVSSEAAAIKTSGKAAQSIAKVSSEAAAIKTSGKAAQSIEKVSSEAAAIKTSGKAAQSIAKVSSEAAAIKTSGKAAQSIEKVSSEAAAIKTSGKVAQSIEKVSSEAAAIKTSGKVAQSIEKVSSEAAAIKTSGKVAQSIEKVSSEAAAIKTSGKAAQSIEKVSSEANASGKKVKDPQKKEEGTAKKNREHHDKKSKEKKQELRDEGCVACGGEITFKTVHKDGKVRKNGKGKPEISSRPDILYIDQNGNLNLIEIKTGKGKLSKNQKILGEAYKNGTAMPAGEKLWEFLDKNKQAFPDYREEFMGLKDGFTGTAEEFDERLKELNTKWLNKKKDDFKDGVKIQRYDIIRYPGRLE